MIKTLGFFKKKQGMSRATFIDRYENPHYGHAQLAMRFCPWQEDYRRNFLLDKLPDTSSVSCRQNSVDIDVVMMSQNRDREQARLTASALADPRIGDLIARDEEEIFDRPTMTLAEVKECATPPSVLKPCSNCADERPARKILTFCRKQSPGQSWTQFATEFEAGPAILLSQLRCADQPLLAGYKRNYIQHSAMDQFSHIPDTPMGHTFDLVSELWFWSDEDCTLYLELAAKSAISDQLGLYGGVVDLGSRVAYFAEEYVHTGDMLQQAVRAHEENIRPITGR